MWPVTVDITLWEEEMTPFTAESPGTRATAIFKVSCSGPAKRVEAKLT